MGRDDTKKYVVVGVVVALIILLMWFVTGAKADTLVSKSGAQSSSTASANVNSQSGAYAGGGSVIIAPNPTETRSEIIQSGKSTVRTAPAVQAPSMGSGHPCGLSGSIGISIIGGGASGGASTVDEACLLAQMGQGEAALIMIARRDKEACMALRAVGRIPAGSTCYPGEKRQAATTLPANVSRIPTCPTGSKWDGKGCWMPRKR